MLKRWNLYADEEKRRLTEFLEEVEVDEQCVAPCLDVIENGGPRDLAARLLSRWNPDWKVSPPAIAVRERLLALWRKHPHMVDSLRVMADRGAVRELVMDLSVAIHAKTILEAISPSWMFFEEARAAVPTLIEKLETQPFLRPQVVWALGQVRDRRAIKPLLISISRKEGQTERPVSEAG